MSNSPLEELSYLRSKIVKYNDAYYGADKPEVSDAEYDRLYKQLKEIEGAYSGLVTEDSPTQKLTYTLPVTVAKIKHSAPMLSLYTETDFTSEGAIEFVRRVSAYLVNKRIVENRDRTYCCEPKYDGLAVSLRYVNGQITCAATRGDGEYGEDVTTNVSRIANIPKRLLGEDDQVTEYPPVLEVRGEVLMPLSTFKRLNAELVAQGKKPYVNARAAAAGSLRLQNADESAARGLIFYAYAVANPDEVRQTFTYVKEHSSLLYLLGQWGLPTSPYGPNLTIWKVTKDPDYLTYYHDQILKERKELDFEIDGVVYKVDSLDLQQELGYAGKEPRWATAHKFEPDKETTVIKSIDLQVGRTGKITPVARLSPVFVGGTTISNVSLHNNDEIRRLGVDVGDEVYVQRAGDVIPEITAVFSKAIEGSVFRFPENCPCCGSPLVRYDGEVDFRCPGGATCPAQQVQALIHFVSREAMNIQGVGERLIEQLHEAGHLDTIADLFCLGSKQSAKSLGMTTSEFIRTMQPVKILALAYDTLSGLEGYGPVAAANILAAIQSAKECTLPKFLIGLGIRYAGKGTAKRLSEHFGRLEAIQAAPLDYLETIKDIGPVVALSVYEFFNSPRTHQLLEDLEVLGVSPQPTVIRTESSGTRPRIAITGKFRVSREETIALIQNLLDADITSDVGAKTDLLICGEKPSSGKVKTAESLHIPIIKTQEMEHPFGHPEWFSYIKAALP